MFVSGILREALDFLRALRHIQLVPKSTSPSPEPVAELPLLDRHVGSVILLVDRKILQGSPACGLSNFAGFEGDIT